MSLPLPILDPATLRHSALIGRPIDNTALSAYMRCPWLYYGSMVLNRRREGPPPPSLGFGSAWHVAMEVHYKSPVVSLDDLYGAVEVEVASRWTEHSKPDDHRTLQRCLLEYRKFLKQYGPAWEQPEKTVGWPESPLVEHATELAIPGVRHPYAGKIDRIFEENGLYFIEDHKTASRDEAGYFRAFALDNQMMGYAALAWLLTGQPIAGVRISRLVVRKNDSLHDRGTISFSPPRLKDWMRNLDKWLARIEFGAGMVRDAEALDDEVGQAEAIDAAFPRNFSACSGKYGPCTYVDICSLPPSLRQGALESDFNVAPWNPLEAAEETPE